MNSKEVRSLMEAYASVYEGYKEKEEKGEKEEKDCVDKEEKGKHNCAKKVCHEQFGEGTCIFGEHAVPDENGFVSHYDVLFNHGVEKDVPVSEMEVLEEGSHNEDYHRYEGEMVDEGMGLVTGTAKAVNAVLKPKGQTPEEGKKAVGNLTKAMDVVAKPVKSAAKAVLGVGSEKNAAMMNKRRPTAAQSAKMEEVDIFDIVKGYLIGEGATEEEVYDMMAHLTDEQRDAIVEERGPHYGLVGVPKKAIDKIPGVRALRTAASNTLHRMDYQHNAKPVQVGDKVVPYYMINPGGYGGDALSKGYRPAGRVTNLKSGKSKSGRQISDEL